MEAIVCRNHPACDSGGRQIGIFDAEHTLLSSTDDAVTARGTAEHFLPPTSRKDIADHLGLTIDTVSRSRMLLEGKAAIERPSGRKICSMFAPRCSV